MTERACENCHVSFPLSKEFWHRSNSSSDGYRKTCKMCRAEEREGQRKQEVDERVKKIEDGGFDLLDKLAQGGSEVPHMAETLQYIMEAFGGPGGFAQQFMANYLRSPPGSPIRQKAHDTVIRLVTKVSDSGAAQRSLEEITDEELEREIQRETKRIMQVDPSKRPFKKNGTRSKKVEAEPVQGDTDS